MIKTIIYQLFTQKLLIGFKKFQKINPKREQILMRENGIDSKINFEVSETVERLIFLVESNALGILPTTPVSKIEPKKIIRSAFFRGLQNLPEKRSARRFSITSLSPFRQPIESFIPSNSNLTKKQLFKSLTSDNTICLDDYTKEKVADYLIKSLQLNGFELSREKHKRKALKKITRHMGIRYEHRPYSFGYFNFTKSKVSNEYFKGSIDKRKSIKKNYYIFTQYPCVSFRVCQHCVLKDRFLLFLDFPPFCLYLGVFSDISELSKSLIHFQSLTLLEMKRQMDRNRKSLKRKSTSQIENIKINIKKKQQNISFKFETENVIFKYFILKEISNILVKTEEKIQIFQGKSFKIVLDLVKSVIDNCTKENLDLENWKEDKSTEYLAEYEMYEDSMKSFETEDHSENYNVFDESFGSV